MQVVRKSILAALALVCLPWAAQAGWSVGVRIGVPCYRPYYGYYYYSPYPVYVRPAPLIVEPAPVLQPVPVPVESVHTLPAPTPVPATESPSQIEQYLQQMSGPDEHVRAEAMVQLGRLKAQRAVEPLSRALASDRSATVREAAARALGLIGSPASLAALQRAAQADDDREVRHSAQFAAEVIRANLPR
jgi:hypothetical protein